MKTAKIHINKSTENPKGTEIEIIQPDNNLEGRVLSFLLANSITEASRENRIPYKLPKKFHIEHRSDGTFIVMGTPSPKDTAAPLPGGGYYQPPKPLAIVGIRAIGNRFDLIHAEVPAKMPKPRPDKPAKPAAAKA